MVKLGRTVPGKKVLKRTNSAYFVLLPWTRDNRFDFALIAAREDGGNKMKKV